MSHELHVTILMKLLHTKEESLPQQYTSNNTQYCHLQRCEGFFLVVEPCALLINSRACALLMPWWAMYALVIGILFHLLLLWWGQLNRVLRQLFIDALASRCMLDAQLVARHVLPASLQCSPSLCMVQSG